MLAEMGINFCGLEPPGAPLPPGVPGSLLEPPVLNQCLFHECYGCSTVQKIVMFSSSEENSTAKADAEEASKEGDTEKPEEGAAPDEDAAKDEEKKKASLCKPYSLNGLI